MRMMLFNCHHTIPDNPLTAGMFATLVSGAHDAPDGTCLGDLGGHNIADRNEHSEMRHQVFVWKNRLGLYDWVGFEHYRRLFFLDPLSDLELQARFPALHGIRSAFLADERLPRLDLGTEAFRDHARMRSELNAEATGRLQSWIASADVIVQRPLVDMPLDAQWRTTHMAEYWPVLESALTGHSSFRSKPIRIDFASKAAALCNMYIMRSELFDEYMRFWDEAIASVAARVPAYPRLLGHFSERIFSYFLHQKRFEHPLLRVRALPHVFHNPDLDRFG